MEYNTRMLARKAFTYMGRELQAGDPLFASAVDAGYLSKVGRAELAPLAVGPAAAAVQHVQTAPVEPVAAETAISAGPAEAAAVEAPPAADSESAAEALEHAAPAPEVVDVQHEPEQPVTRRRGGRRSASQA